MNNILNNDIILDKESHQYRLKNDSGQNFTSVTTFVGEFFEEFNAKKIAKKLIRHYPKYKNYSVKSLIESWNKAAEYGSMVHEQIENWILHGTEPSDQKAINGKNWLEGYKLKSDINILSEVIVYSTELSIAGTVDILAKDNNTGWYEIIDWKTSKRIDTSSYNEKMGTHKVTQHVMDCNFNHYALQLSLYRYILEIFYELEINNQIIAHLKNDKVNALHVPYMRKEIEAMLYTKRKFI